MKITTTVELPTDAMKHHWAVLGITGSGKSYAVRGVIEKLLKAGERVCIIDPKGDWWGLKSSADGKSAGFPVVIFGGDHADVQINPTSGAVVGELIATGNRPAIIDLKHFSQDGKCRFMVDFYEAIFKKNRARITLVLEEAHEFAPQRPMREENMLLHWTNKLLSQGRSLGFQIVLSSQRPAKVHKDSLTQAQVLFAMRVISVQDRDAVKAWVDGVGDRKSSQQVMDSLARLQTGHGWIYAPTAEILHQVHFPRIETFDSSATPDSVDAEAPKGWASVDLSEISAKLANVQAEVQANDPAKLKAEIKDLRAKLQTALATPVQIDAGELGKAKEEIDRYRTFASELQQYSTSLRRWISGADVTLNQLLADLGKLNIVNVPALQQAASGRPSTPIPQVRPALASRSPAKTPAAPAAAGSGGGNRAASVGSKAEGLTGPQQRVLDAIAWWESCGIYGPRRESVAFIAGYTPTSGTWRTLLSSCVQAGLIQYDNGNCLALTELGDTAANHDQAPGTNKELHSKICRKLTGPQIKVFTVLTDGCEEPKTLSRTHVAELAGYEVTSGTFRTLLSSLSSIGLITYPNKTTIAAAPAAFLSPAAQEA